MACELRLHGDEPQGGPAATRQRGERWRKRKEAGSPRKAHRLWSPSKRKTEEKTKERLRLSESRDGEKWADPTEPHTSFREAWKVGRDSGHVVAHGRDGYSLTPLA